MKAEAMKVRAGVVANVFVDILAESGDELSVPLSRDEARTVAEILRAVAGGEIWTGNFRKIIDQPVLVIGGGA